MCPGSARHRKNQPLHSTFIDGALYLTLKSSTPAYKGFKVDFGAKNLTRPSGSLSHGGTSASEYNK